MSVVAARQLKDRYARLKGRLTALREPAAWTLRLAAHRAAWEANSEARSLEINELCAEMERLAAIIPDLDPQWSPEKAVGIRPVKRRRELGHGDFTREAFAALNALSYPPTSREIVDAVCTKLGLKRDATVERESKRDNVHKALSKLEQHGMVTRDGEKPCRWHVLDEDG